MLCARSSRPARTPRPLLLGLHLPRAASARLTSRKKNRGRSARLPARVGRALGVTSKQYGNPIGEDRKRMGFVVVADVASENSFTVA